MSPVWYLNGKWAGGTPFLSAHDAGLVYGAVVTDRLRTVRHVPFQLTEHVARFRQSCALAHVPVIVSAQETVDIVHQLVERSKTQFEVSDDFAIVMLATPGPVDGHGPPTLIMHTLPLDYARFQVMFRRGVHLAVATMTRQIPHSVFTPNIKHRSRLNWWMARQEVQEKQSSAEAVLLDDAGLITETASANIVVVKDGELHSPPLNSILIGTGLTTLEKMSQRIGRTIHKTRLRPEDCWSAHEILLTNSSWFLAAASQFDGRSIPGPGPMFEQFSRLWKELLGMDYMEQIANATC